jgi:hypothetical protein
MWQRPVALRDAISGWALTIILVVALWTLIVLIMSLAPSLEQNVALQGLLVGVVGSATAWIVGRQYGLSKDVRGRVRFIGLFGEEAALRDLSLVYPAFEIDPAIIQLVETTTHPELRFIKTRPVYGPRRADIRVLAAENDVRALVEVANLFGDHGRSRVHTYMDGDFVSRGAAGSFVSFGLSSNECTHHYLGNLTNYERQRLFEIEVDYEDEVLRLADGSTFRTETNGNHRFHPGVIVRHRPVVEDPTRYWFLVAGFGAPATPGAAYWLRERWRILADLAAATGSVDFVAVIRTEAHAERNTRLVRFFGDNLKRKDVPSTTVRRAAGLIKTYVEPSRQP